MNINVREALVSYVLEVARREFPCVVFTIDYPKPDMWAPTDDCVVIYANGYSRDRRAVLFVWSRSVSCNYRCGYVEDLDLMDDNLVVAGIREVVKDAIR